MLIGITGHKGVLGSIIKQQLTELGIAFLPFEGDITQPKDIENWLSHTQLTHIIHLAALVSINSVNQDFKKAIEINIQGSINLAHALEKIRIKPYVFYASTCHVYRSSERPIKETDVIDPINNYGTSKYIAEVLLEHHARQHTYGLCIGRIFSFYHSTQKIPFLYPTMLKRLSEENLDLAFQLKGASAIRDLSNAEDICRLIIKLVRKNIIGTFNIGSGKGKTIKEFVQSLTDKKLNFLIDENEKPQFLVADISKLKEVIDINES